MTTTVVDPAREHSAPLPPIVLTINCSDKAQYLNGSNKVLEALLGCRLDRVECNLDKAYVYPALSTPAVLLDLQMQDPDNLTLTQARELLENETVMCELVRTKLRAALEQQVAEVAARRLRTGFKSVTRKDNEMATYQAVRVIFVDQSLSREESRLLTAIEPLFPCATFFSVDSSGSNLPELIQKSQLPLCMNCRKEMRPAGDAFVCESCGATAGGIGSSPKEDDVLCPGCSYPMEEVVRHRRLGSRTYHCNRCGHEITT